MKTLGIKDKRYSESETPEPTAKEPKEKIRFPTLRIEGEDRIKALGLEGAAKGDKATITIEVEIKGVRDGSMYEYDDAEDSKPEIALRLVSGEGTLSPAKGKRSKVLDIINRS